MRVLYFCLLFLPLLLLSPVQADDAPSFFLHDGDTVVFYGDSITEQQHYGRDIETYVLTRYPTWHVKFINSGWTSDLVSGGKGGTVAIRLKRDVLPYHPTVVTILLGMNDGEYTRFSQKSYEAYAQGLTYLVNKLSQQIPGVRLTLLSPTFYDENAPGSRHFHGYNDVMRKFRDFVKTLGGRQNILAVDLNAPLAQATQFGRRHDPHFTLVPDGIHPNEAGHAIIAATLLKAWHASSEPTEITLDPKAPVTATTPLPWPLPDKATVGFSVSPLLGPLNRFHARAADLLPGEYDLLVDGKRVGTMTSKALAAGIDLTQMPALPQNKQAAQVRDSVQSRLDTWRTLWNGSPKAVAHKFDAPSDAEVAALIALDHWLDERRDTAHAEAQPQPHTYRLRLVPPISSQSATPQTLSKPRTPRRTS